MGNFSKAILIASVALCLHISAFSQGISLKNREISVKEAMELLKEKSGYSFVFSSADVNTNKRISISTDKATIDDVVKQILQGQNNLTYEIQNKRIIVKKIQSGDKTKNKRIKAIGKVVDDAGEPIIGATIREQGTTNGTVTGIDGGFSLDVADNVNLEISYIGYETRKIRAQQGKKLDITMREDANVLDEIVVLGYGNIRRSDVTGSIASVSSESISKVASASVADALAGKMAGVQITTADGALDAEISVRVRGGGSITQDNSPLVGQTSNKGVEISLDAKIIQTKDFQLSANFNVAFNKNKVDKLATGETEWKTKASLSNWYGTYNYKMEVGKSMGLIYGFVNDGFYKVDDFDFDATTKKWTLKPGIPDNSSFSSGNFAFKPGAMKFKKLSDSESNLITEDDMTVIGDTNPKVTGGFGLSGNWKNLDFTAFFNYMCDFDVLNVNKLYLHSAVRRNYSNLSTDMNLANRFRYVDDAGVNVSSDPVALAALNENAKTYSWMSVTQGITMTDLVEDGSFLRLSTLTVGYTLPKHWLRSLGVKSLRLYFSGSNLFTITGYSGYDPEVNIQKGLTPGIDNNVTPRSRVYTVGVNLNF